MISPTFVNHTTETQRTQRLHREIPEQGLFVQSRPITLYDGTHTGVNASELAATPRAPADRRSPWRSRIGPDPTLRYFLANHARVVRSRPTASNDSCRRSPPETSCRDSHKYRR